jgi:ATP-dependent exoDNAse (exonuclease V) beta subunit
MPNRLEDQQARAQALDAAGSYIVQAPAGSGKTELLIQRFLALLARVDAPEEIVAITFTRKAAAEMRGRILAALTAAAGDAPGEPRETHRRHTWELARGALERDRAQGWNLREHPARLRVLTIDAFNLSLVRRMPWLSRLGGAPATVDDARPLFRRAARETLALLESSGPVSDHAAELLRHLDNQVERTEELLGVLLGRRDQWLRHLLPGQQGTQSGAPLRAELEAAWAGVLIGALRTAAQALQPYGAEIAACAAHAAGVLRATRPESGVVALAGLTALPPPTADRVDPWRGLAELLLTGDGSWRSPKGLNRNNGFPNDTAAQKAAKARMGGLLGKLRDDAGAARVPELLSTLPNPAFTDGEWTVIAALLALLAEAVERLREGFRRAGVADFIEIGSAAQAALQVGRSEARPSEDRPSEDRLRHLLLDEFQDTSTSQYRLLERLLADWAPGDGRTLFLVGDPMQSIYRFREAEVGLFLRAWSASENSPGASASGIGGSASGAGGSQSGAGQGIGTVPLRALTLRSNFRSDAAIVDWVNRAFAQVFPTQADIGTGAVPYSAAAAVRPAAEPAAVTVHPIVVPEGEKAWGTMQEAERIAELAWQARRDDPGQSIAILVRARTHLAEILPALRAVDVPYRAVEIDALAEQPVVVDLVALTRALLYPADRTAWLAVLRAPACGLTLADLLALAGEAPGAALWERIQDDAVSARLSPDGQARLGRVRAVLADALAQRARMNLRAWVLRTWVALGGPVGLRAVELGHARAYLGVLEALEQAGGEPAPEELTRHLEGLYAEPGADPAAVQVMTIHKAKGLEFDTVILPGLGRRSGWDMPPLLRWQELPGGGPGSLLLTPIGETGMEQNPNFRYLGWLEREKADQELRRLAYVAATRAKRRLHLLGVAVADHGGVKPPDPRSLLGTLWPALERDFRAAAVTPPQAAAAGSDPSPGALLRRLPVAWTPPVAPPDVRPAAPGATEEAEQEPIEYSWVGFTARRVGTVVHRLLLRMAREGAAAWPAQRIAAQAPVARTLLAQAGVPEPDLDGATQRALEALRATVADEKGRWVLRRHTDDRSEYDVTAVLDGELRRLRVDRTFVDDAGRRWIVDYKTSTHEGGRPEEFLDREMERYRKDMERYARVMRALEPERPVRLALYFPLVQGGWREWDFSG